MIRHIEEGIPSNLKEICDTAHLCKDCKWSRNTQDTLSKSYYYICINGCNTKYDYVNGNILYPYCMDVRKSKTCNFYQEK